MQRKNIWLLIMSTMIFIFDVAMGFILSDYSLKIVATDSKILYICIKCIVVALWIAISALGFLKKDSSNYILQYVSTLLLQFVPLAVRYLSAIDKGFLISIILTFIALIIYVGITLGFSVLSKKTIHASKKLEGKIITIKEEKDNVQN